MTSVNQLKVEQLKDILKYLNLKCEGKKDILVAKLETFLEMVDENLEVIMKKMNSGIDFDQNKQKRSDLNVSETVVNNNENKSDSESEYSSIASANSEQLRFWQREKCLLEKENHLLERELNLLKKYGAENPRSDSNHNRKEHRLHPGELEKLLPVFNPGKSVLINSKSYVSKLECLQKSYDWSDTTTLLYGRTRLGGAAQIWSQNHLSADLDEFRTELVKNFPVYDDEVEIHSMLARRRKRSDESYDDFVYAIKNLADKINLSDQSIITYIIKGIDDTNIQSILSLQQFNSVFDLLHLLNHHSRIGRQIQKPSNPRNAVSKPSNVSKNQQEKSTSDGISKKSGHCFNCNEDGHWANECSKPKRLWGSCFKCGKSGHSSKDCKSVGSSSAANKNLEKNENINFVFNPNYLINVKVRNDNIESILDSGSPISIIQNKFVKDLKLKSYTGSNFVGVGGHKLDILGNIDLEIEVSGVNIPIMFFVVSESKFDFPCLLGRDFMNNKNVKICFDSGEMSISVTTHNTVSESQSFDILKIDLFSNENETALDVEESLDSKAKDCVYNMYERYLENLGKYSEEFDYDMKIVLNKDQPFFYKPRRLSYVERNKVQDLVNDLLDKGIIRVSHSKYSSPIVLVKKKSGDIRMCVDYRHLNRITEKDNFPLPLIEDMLDQLNEKKFYTALDLKSAFHHVKMDEKSIPLTSFVTPFGQYEYVRMPFGLTNAPSVFQRYISSIFRDLIEKNKILIYLDDIFIATKTLEEHFLILEEVFGIMAKYNLELRIDKCHFLKLETKYLGYVINERGIKPNSDNIRNVEEFPIPKSSAEVHSFLGLCSYFRKFVENFAVIAKPLYDLIRKGVEFKFGDRELEIS